MNDIEVATFIAALPATRWGRRRGVVEIPDGEHVFDAPVLIAEPVEIRGFGNSSITVSGDFAAFHILHEATDTAIRNLSIRSVTAGVGVGIEVQAGRCIFDDLGFYDMAIGINAAPLTVPNDFADQVYNTDGIAVRDSEFAGCTIGLNLAGGECSTGVVQSCRFTNCATCVFQSTKFGNTFLGCDCEGAGTGFDSALAQANDQSTYVGCFVELQAVVVNPHTLVVGGGMTSYVTGCERVGGFVTA